jgi:hypothetical protein
MAVTITILPEPQKVPKNTCIVVDKMGKCQYILECDLPSLATPDQLQKILDALSDRTNAVNFGDSAQQWLTATDTAADALCDAIQQHIQNGQKVFQKFEKGSRTKLLPDDVQANITVFAGEDDLYVSIWIQSGTLINIYAHEHPPGKPRLPK